MRPTDALIIVDVQNDFVSGSLAVPGAAEIIPVINQLAPHFGVVVATADWHPDGHCSFNKWPEHCVANTWGAKLADAIENGGYLRPRQPFLKGIYKDFDSYSGFYSAPGFENALLKHLRMREVTDVYVCGLATDYCVKATAIDAALLGFKTHVIENACRGVNVNPGDVENAFNEMREAGVEIVNLVLAPKEGETNEQNR